MAESAAAWTDQRDMAESAAAWLDQRDIASAWPESRTAANGYPDLGIRTVPLLAHGTSMLKSEYEWRGDLCPPRCPVGAGARARRGRRGAGSTILVRGTSNIGGMSNRPCLGARRVRRAGRGCQCPRGVGHGRPDGGHPHVDGVQGPRRAQGDHSSGGRGGKPKAQSNRALVLGLARAHRWQRMIDSGEVSGLEVIAAQQGVGRSYVSRIVQLPVLAPELVGAILADRGPNGLSLAILHRALSLRWDEWRKVLWDASPLNDNAQGPAMDVPVRAL
jgi:hypothetical protein